MRAAAGVLLALWLAGSGCRTAGPGDTRTIRTKGDYAHRGAGIAIPARVGPLERKLLQEFDGNPDDLGAYYQSVREDQPLQANLYVYPAGQAFPGRLKQDFAQRLSALRRGRSRRSVTDTRVVRAPGGTGRAVGYEAAYGSGTGENKVRSVLRVFQCGQWFLRLQASVREQDASMLPVLLDHFHGAVSCEEMADHSPAGDSLGVSIEPGVAGRPEWQAYAEGQVDWLRSHMSPATLALGIPDQNVALFVAGWTRALDVRRAQPDPVPDALFDALERARQAGYLEEYVWSEQLSFLPPPEGLDLEAFRAWRTQQGIAAPYQIRAGAVLTRAQARSDAPR
jgi:hypothetical protein